MPGREIDIGPCSASRQVPPDVKRRHLSECICGDGEEALPWPDGYKMLLLGEQRP